MTDTPKNVAASVLARLLNLSRTTGDDYQMLLTRIQLRSPQFGVAMKILAFALILLHELELQEQGFI